MSSFVNLYPVLQGFNEAQERQRTNDFRDAQNPMLLDAMRTKNAFDAAKLAQYQAISPLQLGLMQGQYNDYMSLDPARKAAIDSKNRLTPTAEMVLGTALGNTSAIQDFYTQAGLGGIAGDLSSDTAKMGAATAVGLSPSWATNEGLANRKALDAAMRKQAFEAKSSFELAKLRRDDAEKQLNAMMQNFVKMSPDNPQYAATQESINQYREAIKINTAFMSDLLAKTVSPTTIAPPQLGVSVSPSNMGSQVPTSIAPPVVQQNNQMADAERLLAQYNQQLMSATLDPATRMQVIDARDKLNNSIRQAKINSTQR